jgi:hypothetical protein
MAPQPTPFDGKWMTAEQILKIKEEHFPFLVLSYNYRSFISTGITHRTTGAYNHLMWAHRPKFFATQDWWFREVPIEKYMKSHRLKFWTNEGWTKVHKQVLKKRIYEELDKTAWETRYDLLAIFGQWIGWTGLQVPWTKICSDHADYLKLVDSRYQLKHPSPADVNRWLKTVPDYKVYARFIND